MIISKMKNNENVIIEIYDINEYQANKKKWSMKSENDNNEK